MAMVTASVEDRTRKTNRPITLGHKSEKAFEGLFNDICLQDTRLAIPSEDGEKSAVIKIGEIDMNLHISSLMCWYGIHDPDRPVPVRKVGGELYADRPSKLCATLATLGRTKPRRRLHVRFAHAPGDTETSYQAESRPFLWQENNPTTYNLHG